MTGNKINEGFLDNLFTTPEKPHPKTEAKKTEKVSFTIDCELSNRLRNIVYWSPEMTMCSLIEVAVEEMINKLEEENGKPYPDRNGKLKKGRKLS